MKLSDSAQLAWDVILGKPTTGIPISKINLMEHRMIDRIAGIRTGLEKSRVASMLEFRASLTPEQQKKLRELRESGPQMHAPGAAPQKKGGDM